jgi:uncharacterized protein YfaP (DUF2135 family)
VGCAGRRRELDVPAVPAADARLAVTLLWTAPVDLDLYVTDPGLETLYFANPRPRSGGVLERDARCADPEPSGPRIERARWTDPPPGRYRVGVDYPEACGGRAAAVPYRLVVDSAGRRQDLTGRAEPLVRDARVLEVVVGHQP